LKYECLTFCSSTLDNRAERAISPLCRKFMWRRIPDREVSSIPHPIEDGIPDVSSNVLKATLEISSVLEEIHEQSRHMGKTQLPRKKIALSVSVRAMTAANKPDNPTVPGCRSTGANGCHSILASDCPPQPFDPSMQCSRMPNRWRTITLDMKACPKTYILARGPQPCAA
jgi:hypothetical protein